MTKEQAIAEAARRSRIRVTADGDTEAIYVYYPCHWSTHPVNGEHEQFRVSRWIDIPYGSYLTACYHNGEPQTRFEPIKEVAL